jgi:hypothetical protein
MLAPDAAGAPLERRLAWGGITLRMSVDDARHVDLVERYLALSAEPCAAGEADVPLAAEVDTVAGGGHRFSGMFGESEIAAWDDSCFFLLEAIAYGFALTTDRLVVHAGGFVDGGGAIVFLGEPFAGKSSLAFAAWRAGLDVIGDDRLCIDPDSGEVSAYPKCLKLRVGDGEPPRSAAGVIAEGNAFVGSLGGDRRLVMARSLPGFRRYGDAAPMRALVWLTRGGDTRSRIDRVRMIEAIDDLLAQAALAGHTPMDFMRLVKAHSSDDRLIRLTVGDGEFDEAIELLRTL